MTVHDENGVYRSLARERRNQRRKQLGVALAGLAAIAGAGTFAAQIEIVDLMPSADRPLVIAQPVRTPSASPSPSASVTVVRSKKTVTPWRVVRSGVRQRTSPTPPPPSPSASVLIASAPVVQLDENTASGTIRVTAAAFDLSGRPELALVGDRGWAVGRARCSRSVRPDIGAAVAEPPTLVCWRTSPRRSVVTVATSSRGRPATAESIAVLEREWARLR